MLSRRALRSLSLSGFGPLRTFADPVAIGLALAFLAAGCREGEPPATVAFVDVTVVPMDAPRVLPRQTVLVRGKNIVAVLPAGEAWVPADALSIDGRGKFLMPGLADMHTHVQSEGELLFLVAHGVTTIRDMFGSPYKVVWRDRIARGEMLGPTIHAAGPIVDGDPPNMTEMAIVGAAPDAERVIAEQKRRGYDFVKVYDGLSAEAYQAILAAAKRHGLPVAGHLPGLVKLPDALRMRGQRCFEHLSGYTDALQREGSPYAPPAGDTLDNARWIRSIDYVDERGLTALAVATRDAGAWNCPTLVAFEKWGYTPEEARDAVSRAEMRYVHPLLLSFWLPANQDQVAYSDALYELPAESALMKRRVEVHKRIAKALIDAGAGVLLGTDLGAQFVVPGVSAWEELELLASAGLTPYQALRTATWNAAEFTGARGSFGTVAAGARADLVLLEGDPLRDVRNVRRQTGVMVRGRWLPERELRRRLEDMAVRNRTAKDWFAGRPALPARGPGQRSARYRISSFGLPKGEERLSVEDRHDGRRAVVSQFAAEEPEERFLVRFESVDPARTETLTVESEGREGEGRVVLSRTGSELRIEGRLPVVGTVQRAESTSPGRRLGAPGLSTYVWLQPRLEVLAPGELATVEITEWDFGPAFAPCQRTLKVTREPDATGAGTGLRRSYSIAKWAGGLRLETMRLTIDADGLPASLEIRQGEATLVFVRLGPDGRERPIAAKR